MLYQSFLSLSFFLSFFLILSLILFLSPSLLLLTIWIYFIYFIWQILLLFCFCTVGCWQDQGTLDKKKQNKWVSSGRSFRAQALHSFWCKVKWTFWKKSYGTPEWVTLVLCCWDFSSHRPNGRLFWRFSPAVGFSYRSSVHSEAGWGATQRLQTAAPVGLPPWKSLPRRGGSDLKKWGYPSGSLTQRFHHSHLFRKLSFLIWVVWDSVQTLVYILHSYTHIPSVLQAPALPTPAAAHLCPSHPHLHLYTSFRCGGALSPLLVLVLQESPSLQHSVSPAMLSVPLRSSTPRGFTAPTGSWKNRT